MDSSTISRRVVAMDSDARQLFEYLLGVVLIGAGIVFLRTGWTILKRT
jgi:hypothetical protein